MTQQLAVRQDAAEFAEESESHPNIVVTGRRVVVPEHFREHVAEKLLRLEKFDPRCHRIEVELAHEANPRQSKHCQRVQVTVLGKGPVVRAEARAENFYAALELAGDKLMERLRRSKDRRQVHQGLHRPTSVAEATANGYAGFVPGRDAIARDRADGASAEGRVQSGQWDVELDKEPSGPGQIVRVKSHPAAPMSVDEALSHMELVGHDFYLFHDEATGLPSVVYRRHAFDYGLIRLEQ
ncbi:ribosome hibernation-promoting factor, HPF/YfiA family [Segniliparus rugosus]|uniref:Ribosome hibernation promoting factor n=1 Tax=Segniliparus rugosus (strain ATCC BAA-974 / DSM 45345 / CCUG 50838 / CIP 108380 / JCM 13579 / CDC 945) TaxID=679197 RepID=E5XRH7_SEGRC|nr:ribosome-associated translation inhibitor RaiA [Segniliparus rugosus]EFV13047.1 ribosomal subunit interface protein [Segniliparus rugosus ATCC BAA-974]